MIYQGELAALATACCWTITMMSFEAAGRRIGSLSVNLLRLVLALIFISLYGWIVRGHWLPLDASQHAWIWLTLSGLVGFTIGDMALFRAFVLVGARISSLMMALVPPLTALIGWLALGERLNWTGWLGRSLTVAGVFWVLLDKRREVNGVVNSLPWNGILLGLVSALGQAGGLVLSKYGMRDYDPFAATQIRIIAGLIGFSLVFTFIGWWPNVWEGLKNRPAMRRVGLGAFFGPFLGVSLSLMAVQHTQTGIAATIMATTPILILAPAAIIFKEKITSRAIVGAVLAVIGVAVLFLR